MISVWRLVRQAYFSTPKEAFDGSGAAVAGGRWNRKGTRVTYASSTRSLAVLEILAAVDRRDAPDDYVLARAELNEAHVTTIPSLPADWRSPARSGTTVEIGESFVLACKSLALEAPSAIVPQESNYVINPRHPHFADLKIVRSFEPFSFDERLFGGQLASDAHGS